MNDTRWLLGNKESYEVHRNVGFIAFYYLTGIEILVI